MPPEIPARLDWVARWLQQEDEELDYRPSDAPDDDPDDAPAPLRWSSPARRPRHYILVGHTPVPCGVGRDWEQWFLHADRTVARTTLTPDVVVSTAFLGIDHQHDGDGPPVLFETLTMGLVVPGPWCLYACTWEEAEAAHAAMCASVTTWLSSHPGADVSGGTASPAQLPLVIPPPPEGTLAALAHCVTCHHEWSVAAWVPDLVCPACQSMREVAIVHQLPRTVLAMYWVCACGTYVV